MLRQQNLSCVREIHQVHTGLHDRIWLSYTANRSKRVHINAGSNPKLLLLRVLTDRVLRYVNG